MKNIFITASILATLIAAVLVLANSKGAAPFAAFILLTFAILAAYELVNSVGKYIQQRREQRARAWRMAVAEQYIEDLEGK
jgi:hypothetical protein